MKTSLHIQKRNELKGGDIKTRSCLGSSYAEGEKNEIEVHLACSGGAPITDFGEGVKGKNLFFPKEGDDTLKFSWQAPGSYILEVRGKKTWGGALMRDLSRGLGSEGRSLGRRGLSLRRVGLDSHSYLEALRSTTQVQMET